MIAVIRNTALAGLGVGRRRRRRCWPAANAALAAFARIGALTCAAAMDTRALSYITGIDERRVAIADEQKGLVSGRSRS